MRIDLRIPHIVIDAVQHPAELGLMHVQNMVQPAALIGKTRLVGVGRRHRGHEIGIDDATFHQVDGGVVIIVAQAVEIKVVRNVG